MSTPKRPGPDDMRLQAGDDPALEALLGYVASTAVTPAADLRARIQARIEREPDRTPPRRYVFALLHLRLGTAAGAFRQLVRVTRGQGHFGALLRAQALGLVLITVLAATALAAGAAIGITQLVQDHRPPTMPVPTVVPDPDRTPSPELETPGPTDDVAIRLVDPTHKPVRTPAAATRTPRPDTAHRPGKTAAPDGRGDPDAEATRRPARTPKPTQRPERTERPEPTRTPKPDRTPRPTEHPEPTEPPEDDGGGDGDGDGDGDGHGDGEGHGEGEGEGEGEGDGGGDEGGGDGPSEPDGPDGDHEG